MPHKKIQIENVDQIANAVDKSNMSMKKTIDNLNVKDMNGVKVSVHTVIKRLNESKLIIFFKF